MPMRKWKLSDYCVPESKACQEQVFHWLMLCNATLRMSSCRAPSYLGSHQSVAFPPATWHMHWHTKMKRQSKPWKSRFMAPKPLNCRQINRSRKPCGAGGHHIRTMCHSSTSFIQMDTMIYDLPNWSSCQGLLLPIFPTLLPTSPSSSERTENVICSASQTYCRSDPEYTLSSPPALGEALPYCWHMLLSPNR